MVGAWKLNEGMTLNVVTYMEAVWYLHGSGDFWVEGTAVNMAVVLVHRDLWYISMITPVLSHPLGKFPAARRFWMNTCCSGLRVGSDLVCPDHLSTQRVTLCLRASSLCSRQVTMYTGVFLCFNRLCSLCPSLGFHQSGYWSSTSSLQS